MPLVKGKEEMSILDSNNNTKKSEESRQEATKNIHGFLSRLERDYHGMELPPLEEWTMKYTTADALQQDFGSCDCGIFVCMNIDAIYCETISFCQQRGVMNYQATMALAFLYNPPSYSLMNALCNKEGGIMHGRVKTGTSDDKTESRESNSTFLELQANIPCDAEDNLFDYPHQTLIWMKKRSQIVWQKNHQHDRMMSFLLQKGRYGHRGSAIEKSRKLSKATEQYSSQC
jgi:hypothetical protein